MEIRVLRKVFTEDQEIVQKLKAQAKTTQEYTAKLER